MSAGVITCPSCHNREYEGTLYCSECGSRIQAAPAGGTREEPSSVGDSRSQRAVRFMVPGASALPGLARADARHGDAPAMVELSGKDEYTLGRADPALESAPDVDLTPYDAYGRGVSRLHAVLRRSPDGWEILDLGSTNGTRLNGARLLPQAPQAVRDGDEIRLGDLTLEIRLV